MLNFHLSGPIRSDNIYRTAPCEMNIQLNCCIRYLRPYKKEMSFHCFSTLCVSQNALGAMLSYENSSKHVIHFG